MEHSIQLALDDLHASRFTSIRAAARAHNVNYRTLARRAQGGISKRAARVEQQLLSSAQEEILVQWILDLEQAGNAPNHAQLREMASLISRISGGSGILGINWVSRFLSRHPDIHTKVGAKIESLRIQNTSPAALEEWFRLFRSVQQQYQVKEANIWNMDETGIALGVCSNQTVIGSSSTRRSYIKRPENREWVSIIESISAGGQRTKSLVIFKGKTIQNTWFSDKDIPDWLYTTSENGWTSNAIGLRWLRDIFLPETRPEGNEARILLVDGHGSHATIEFMWECRQNNVHLVYLPPHSSHVLQPLDLACFGPFKSRYRAQIANPACYEDTAPIKKIRFIQYY
jgi:hypothetical protein